MLVLHKEYNLINVPLPPLLLDGATGDVVKSEALTITNHPSVLVKFKYFTKTIVDFFF